MFTVWPAIAIKASLIFLWGTVGWCIFFLFAIVFLQCLCYSSCLQYFICFPAIPNVPRSGEIIWHNRLIETDFIPSTGCSKILPANTSQKYFPYNAKTLLISCLTIMWEVFLVGLCGRNFFCNLYKLSTIRL